MDALDYSLIFIVQDAPFVMYSYARARSILSKSEEDSEIIWEFDEPESELMKKISLFPEVVEDAMKHSRPDKIARYSYELAGAFNQFYRDCPVLDSGKSLQRRIEIVLILPLHRNTLQKGQHPHQNSMPLPSQMSLACLGNT